LRAFLEVMESRLMSGRLLAWGVLVLTVLLVLSAASAPAAPRSHRACTSGASSVHAEMVNGRIVVSTPVVTGCIPR
jgi:hypothetical protein